MSIYLASALVCLLLNAGSPKSDIKMWKQNRIIITFWSAPPATDSALATVAAEGYNLTWAPESGLDTVQKYGLKAMLQDSLLIPETLDKPDQRAKLDALIQRVKKHPALEAYFITDEPGAAAFPGLGRLTAYLHEHDHAHYAYINLLPTYANNEQLGTKGDTAAAYQEHLTQFIKQVKPEILSYDHYHFFKTNDGEQYFLNLGLIRQNAQTAGVPFVNIIQACTIEKTWRLPVADEVRWLVYTTLAYGGRGISYFLYSGPVSYGGLYQEGKKTPLADDVVVLNHEIAALSPVLMHLESQGVYHTDPLPQGGAAIPESSPVHVVGPGEFVLGLFGKNEKTTAFMVVNRSYKSISEARLSTPKSTLNIQEYDRASKKWIKYPALGADGILTVSLKPGDGRLFRLMR